MFMRLSLALTCVVLSGLAAPSNAAAPSSHDVTFVIERIQNTGGASFRLDLVVDPGNAEGFLGDIEAKLDANGRPTFVQPGIVTSLNEHRDPVIYAGTVALGTCTVGVCDTGRTALAAFTVEVDDSGPSATPTVVVVARAQTMNWSFSGRGYRMRRAPSHFRFVTGNQSGAAGADYLGTGAEAYTGNASAPGGSHGSLAVGVAPCATSGSGLVPRGFGKLQLTGGSKPVEETCPIDDGRLGQGSSNSATWRLVGTVIGDQDFRGSRLLVVDLPLK